jgi:hypothetical protein
LGDFLLISTARNGPRKIEVDNEISLLPVADPFLGSGTVPVAFKGLNLRLVGCDEDEAAFNTTLARLAQDIESECKSL